MQNIISKTSLKIDRIDQKSLFKVYISPFLFTEATDSTGFAAVKLTALGRPQLLVLFVELVVYCGLLRVKFA